MVSYNDVVDTVVELFREAETSLGDDVISALQAACEREEGVARKILEAILRNIELAREKRVPMCQDTGLPVIFVELGRDLGIEFNLRDAITEGVVRATKEVPLRPNAVHPLTRHNSGDNTGMHMPLIYFDIVEGSELRLTVMPKGAGSENVSAIKMMLPGDVDKIPLFVAEVVRNAGGKPCPPVIVGVGIGTTFDGAAKLAKKALLRDITKMSKYEQEILEKVNSLGIGPMGLGGKTTALSVLVEMGHCHTASLPVAVNIQCWANRHATAVLG
ncbi:fumarate hydratase [Archaeoglobus veneficus]|uniref:Hydro-lyase, Fe-S type, tartrate/fumarate subfamily, alpha subunit n=1 Tax=Archaeoglobus veneficus (strain DSM 11195 / SNP6) TaxID=693661 RepID=F2KNW8_ARCVS|nr:fumarate hydratase [Archaeoglobus veneficus]AEA47445.1 hydro-lyase, Fe-S type, tartrate/fumarate subfamily, alpha subunit [Archaeoglobus veneficus SNP6]